MVEVLPSDYGWGEEVPHTQAYLVKPMLRLLQEGSGPGSRVLDLGCGNGALADRLTPLGYEVVGVDPVPAVLLRRSGVSPHLRFTRRQPQRKIFAN